MAHSYKRAAEIQKKYNEEIMKIKGVNGIGVGRGSDYGGKNNPCIVIYLDHDAEKEKIPKKLEEIPVYIERTDPFEAL